MMMVTMMFAWNVAFVVAFQMLVAFIAYSYTLRKRRRYRNWQYKNNNADEENLVNNNEEEEEEMMTQNLLFETNWMEGSYRI